MPLTSDQFVAETSNWKHTTLTTDKYPCPPAGFKPKNSAVVQPQTHASDRAAASVRIRLWNFCILIRKIYLLTFRVGLYVFTGHMTIMWLAAIIFVCYATVSRWQKKPKPCFEEVLQSVDRPGQGSRFPGAWGSQISRQSVHEGGNVVGRMHLPPLTPRKYCWISFLLWS